TVAAGTRVAPPGTDRRRMSVATPEQVATAPRRAASVARVLCIASTRRRLRRGQVTAHRPMGPLVAGRTPRGMAAGRGVTREVGADTTGRISDLSQPCRGTRTPSGGTAFRTTSPTTRTTSGTTQPTLTRL